ncbi:MAG: ABC transporter ATP-binding protein [Kocuria sp.]|nr:ABC transporter ATP-binding protein [Kocuria sp.]
MSLISATGLHFEFIPGRPILDDAHFNVDAAEVVVLGGPNGSGKSTLLNIVAGALRPNSGQVTVDGYPAYAAEGRRARWHMTTRPALFRLLTVREQLEFYAAAHGRSATEALELVRELIPEDVSDQLCAQLSTGQAQKVWFAATLAAHHAPVLLLDEPFSTIDVESVPLMVELLEEQRSSGRALVLVTHVHQDVLPNTWAGIDVRSLSRVKPTRSINR